MLDCNKNSWASTRGIVECFFFTGYQANRVEEKIEYYLHKVLGIIIMFIIKIELDSMKCTADAPRNPTSVEVRVRKF